MIRILLIEDVTVVRESLAAALITSADIDLQCCASNAEGVEILDRSCDRFDVVLLKYREGGERPDSLLSLANQKGLRNRVLIMTPMLSVLEHRRLANLGVAGIFAKQRPLLDLFAVIREMAGAPNRSSKHHAKLIGKLSNQERRAAEFVLEGLANKEIALSMGISESYVKALLQRVFLKSGVRSRSQLVRSLMEKSLTAHHHLNESLGVTDASTGVPGGEHEPVP